MSVSLGGLKWHLTSDWEGRASTLYPPSPQLQWRTRGFGIRGKKSNGAPNPGKGRRQDIKMVPLLSETDVFYLGCLKSGTWGMCPPLPSLTFGTAQLVISLISVQLK